MLILVTVLSLTIGAAAAGFAWHVARRERRRSDARVDALAADIELGEGDDLPRADGTPTSQVPTSHTMFDAIAKPSVLPRAALAGAVALLAVVAVAAGVAVSRSAADAAAVQRPARAAKLSASPARADGPGSLELVGLEHSRAGSGLVVRGAVRLAGQRTRPLTAVVTLLGTGGEVVASRSTPLEGATSAPHAEATFSVRFPRESEAARARVSFEDAQGVVPHLDRRR
jgi:hypothetical protein